MKAYNDIDKPNFTPLTVRLQLESQKEVDALAQLCNYVPIVEWALARGLSLPEIRHVLEETHECDTNTTPIHTFVKGWVKAQCNLIAKNWG